MSNFTASMGVVLRHCSPTSIARRFKRLGLTASSLTTERLPETVKRQLVLDQLEKDPGNRKGPKLIKEAIAFDTGLHLTR